MLIVPNGDLFLNKNRNSISIAIATNTPLKSDFFIFNISMHASFYRGLLI